jgi:hypothetical protein
MRRKGAGSLLLRITVMGTAAAIAFTAFGAIAATAAIEKATINTFDSWDHSSSVAPFGCPDSTTYGQTITVPGGKSQLNEFQFTWRNSSGGGMGDSMLVRAEVYAWNGTKATGSSLYEKKRNISFMDGLFHRETFTTSGISVTPGAQYVLFASIDKDYQKCHNNYRLAWGFAGGAYDGGDFVFQNNHGGEARWTSVAWSSIGGDLAVQAFLS